MQNSDPTAQTVLDRLQLAIESAAVHNPSDAERPAAVLRTDADSRWLPIIPQLRRLMPQLLTLGEF